MKRFLLVLALVAVAGATYVATAPGSQTAAPTARQFKALKKEVTGLKKEVTGLKKEAGQVKGLAVADTELLLDCMSTAVPIDEFGDTSDDPATSGYSYTDPNINGGTPFLTTALDITASDDPNALWITGSTTSACGNDLNPALRKAARLAGLRLPSATLPTFHAARH